MIHQVAAPNSNTAGHLQAILSKLLTYRVLRSTQPPTAVEREMSNSLQATSWRPNVPDWGGGISASCRPRV